MNMDFLDTPLQEMNEDFSEYYFEDMPKDWKMKPNVILEDMGEITPHEEIESFEINVSPLLFRGITTYNPNFMTLFDKEDLPLTEIDIGAWYLMRYVVGDVEFPSSKERRECDKRRILKSMQDPYARYQIDSNWFTKWYKLGDDHWAWKTCDPRHKVMKESFCRLKIQLNASDMIDAGYPADIGNIDQLNEKGEMLVKMLMEDWMAHDSLDPNSEDSAWKTYRDTDATKFVSIYSGAVAAPLRCHWMDYIDVTADDTHMICAPRKGENDATSSLACEEKKDDCIVHVS
uniref:Uncharacterized protein n=1 Tax=Proboscia inermis TaxID=420281 RepID=A0A7S0CLG9_9STRA|mmetsp:Transcript_5391/g.5613  ORF Transcript_5391/g.5613 Transcript_5391/m.5613 type:complete len:288 (+) Transcript_5391:2-865(+)